MSIEEKLDQLRKEIDDKINNLKNYTDYEIITNTRINQATYDIQYLKDTLHDFRNEYINVVNTTHKKIEIQDNQLHDKIDHQQKIISALILILIQNGLIENEGQVADIMISQETMKELSNNKNADVNEIISKLSGP